MSTEREYSPHRFAVGAVFCPACRMKLERDAKWCPACEFTGAKSLDLFGADAPPLLPLMDVADIWDAKEKRMIRAQVKRLCRRFPQIRWRVCGVSLGRETSLPLFGFWLLNASPLTDGETAEDRSWTVLLLVDSETGRTSVTTGYRMEPWLSDDMWERALSETVEPFRNGHPGLAVCSFLKEARVHLEKAWRRSRKQTAHQPYR